MASGFSIWTGKCFCLYGVVLHPGWMNKLRPESSTACLMIMFQYVGPNVDAGAIVIMIMSPSVSNNKSVKHVYRLQ